MQTRGGPVSFADAPVLNQLRRFHGSIANRILYGVLALAFVVWGVGSFGGEGVDVVAEVHGQRITRRDVDREAALLQRRYEALLKGVSLPRMPDLRNQALDNLIDGALVKHEIHTLGLEVSDEELDAAIVNMPELQENGRFNRELLARILDAQRDRGEFEESLRRDLREQRLRNLVTVGVQVSDAEVEDRYKLDHEQVNLTFAKIATTDLAKSATPTDADLEAEVKAHEERYKTPATVRARYVVYRRSEFENLAKPTDDQVAAFYKQHADDRFSDGEQVRVEHILARYAYDADDAAKAKAKAKAERWLGQVQGGADFEELAKKASEDIVSAPKGGDLGFFGRDHFAANFDDVVFALEPGKVADQVIETPVGYHVVKLLEKRAAGTRPVEVVRPQIEQELTANRSLELARTQADSDRRAIIRGKTLAEAVGSRPVLETPPFAVGADVPGVGKVKPFVDAAFNLDENEVSDMIETDDAIYMLTPFERKDPAVPPLDEIRARVEQDAKRTIAERLAKEQGEKLLARAKDIGLEKAAAETNVKLDETGAFDRRTGVIPKIGPSPELRTDAFALTADTPLGPRVYTAAGDAVVVALKARIPADMKDLETARPQIRDALVAQRRQATLVAFMSHLKERAVREGALRVQADALDRG